MKKLPHVLAPLMRQPNWVIWKWRGDSKVPFQALRPSVYASTTDPTTWETYARCRAVSANVGFVLKGSGIGALDLDDCRDDETEELAPWAHRLVERARTYAEVTPSGCGIRIIGYGDSGEVHAQRKIGRGKVEIYRDCARYICVTGDALTSCKRLRNIDALIDGLAPSRKLAVAANLDIKQNGLDWREVVKRRKCVALLATVRSDVQQGKRSDVIWLIAKTLRGKGATPGEVAAVLRASKCWQSKHNGNEEALAREVARVFSS
jgi:hypothetical protein